MEFPSKTFLDSLYLSMYPGVLPHVEDAIARQALQFSTRTDTAFGGRLNFSKVDGLYLPTPVYLGFCTTLMDGLTPGATLVK